jgi:hypothetical protein
VRPGMARTTGVSITAHQITAVPTGPSWGRHDLQHCGEMVSS